MREINIGVIGFGFMGRTHTLAAASLPYYYPGRPYRVRLRGVCSRRLESAESARDELGFDYACDDYRKLLDDPTLDAVSICTPNNLHEEMAVAALNAGKHVYLDKPMTTAHDAALRIYKAAQGSGLTAQMVFNNRCFPVTMRAKQLMEEGRIGDVTSFRIVYLHSGSIDGDKPVSWKQDAVIGGAGVLFDLGAHALDMVRWLMGDIAELLCETRVLHPARLAKDRTPIQNIGDDMALLTLKLSDGAIGTVECSKIATGMNDVFRMEVHGTRGALAFDLSEPNFLRFYDNARPEVELGGERGFTLVECMQRYPKPGGEFLPPKNGIGWVRAHIHSYFTFIENVYNGLPGAPSMWDGAINQYYLQRALESSRSRSWLSCEEANP